VEAKIDIDVMIQKMRRLRDRGDYYQDDGFDTLYDDGNGRPTIIRQWFLIREPRSNWLSDIA
jgi:hypothetical protein